jgi:hypothetical protein
MVAKEPLLPLHEYTSISNNICYSQPDKVSLAENKSLKNSKENLNRKLNLKAWEGFF